MEQLFLMPGEERCERFKDGNGIPRVHYSYRSMHGAFFDCESRSLEELSNCFLISDKARCIAGSVLELVCAQLWK